MAKIQMCRNGCGHYITVQEHEGKWKPFEVSDDGDVLDLHNCPNSPYNKGMSGGSFPTQTQQQTKKPSGGKGSFSIAMPSSSSTNISSGGETMDVKRIRIMLQEFETSMEELKNHLRVLNQQIEANTQIDTNKLIGQLQQIYDFMAKSEKLPVAKPASELFKIPKEESENDPSEEFQRMKQFTKVGDDNNNDDEEDQTKGRATGGVED